MNLTTKKVDGDWRVQGIVETVDVCRTGPSDEPWHIALIVDGLRVDTLGQEATKREALAEVAVLIGLGALTVKGPASGLGQH